MALETDAPGGSGSLPTGARTRGRELALKYLFACDVQGRMTGEDFDAFARIQGARGEPVRFARILVDGVLERLGEIDEEIRSVAEHWTLERMASVDRNILRIGIHELRQAPEVPAAAVINEAVELAKRFSTAQSGGFVNGILDRLKTEGGR